MRLQRLREREGRGGQREKGSKCMRREGGNGALLHPSYSCIDQRLVERYHTSIKGLWEVTLGIYIILVSTHSEFLFT